MAPKVLVITTPIRPIPTDFPPVGSLSVISALKRAGWNNTHFYNIDLLRPDYPQALRRIAAEKPDILAISAVVSTAYEYTKNISRDVKKALPGTTIILGGNLGASAEIILRKTGVDFICTGEGERTMADFVKLWSTAPGLDQFKAVKGLAFLNSGGEFTLTPFPDALKPEELYEIDWSILEDLGQLGLFIIPAAKSGKLAVSDREDPRILAAKRDGKAAALLNTCKGCVARCTFCHRWDKGIRYIPVPVLMKRLDWLIEKHNVGFVRMGDENFGTDKAWLGEFCDEIGKRNVLWRVGGMRVNCISPGWIDRMRAAGCVTRRFGMESGSQKMLDVMEKKTTVAQNRDALRWMVEKNVTTVVQLIVGMPGESHETVAETADFLRYAASISPEWDPNGVSVNFAQALPGTPLYENGRAQGLIGRTLDDEEAYLLKISDRDARDGETAINFTGFPRLTLERWHYDLQAAGRIAYIRKFGMDAYRRILGKSPLFEDSTPKPPPADTGYFASPAREVDFIPEDSSTTDKLHEKQDHSRFRLDNYPSLWRLLRMRKFYLLPILHPQLFMRLRALNTLIVLINSVRKYGLAQGPAMVLEYLAWKLRRAKTKPEPRWSLRKDVAARGALPGDTTSMAPLRAGR